MTQFMTGLACGLLGAGLLAAGLAAAQRPQFQPPANNQVGLPDGRMFVVVCTDAQGFYNGSRRLAVLRPAGDQNSPDVSIRCEAR